MSKVTGEPEVRQPPGPGPRSSFVVQVQQSLQAQGWQVMTPSEYERSSRQSGACQAGEVLLLMSPEKGNLPSPQMLEKWFSGLFQ